MKINEVLATQPIDEGVWDTVKQAGAGLAGATRGAIGAIKPGEKFAPIQGAKAGVAASAASSQQQDLVNRVTQRAVADWAKHSQNLTASGKTPKPADAQSWFTGFTGGKSKPTTLPTSTSPGAMQQWLSKQVAEYMVNKSTQTATPAAPDAEPKQPVSTAQQQEDELVWNPKTNMLSINGVQYLKTKQGWQDYNTKELIAAKDAAELNTAFDQATGRAPVQQPATAQQPAAPRGIQATVATDAGYVYKKEDGNWYRENGTKVNAYDEVEDLEQQWMDARATARAAGQQRDAASQQPATAQQSAGTTIPAPTTAAGGDLFAGDTQLPDVSQLTAAERAELRKQLQA
jgi:hypothetical protein